jgi:cytochrome b subunit of formate dehydrogenase
MTDRELVRDDEVFVRMNLTERLQHMLLILTFVTLMATGLPLFFFEFRLFRWLLPSGKAFAVRGLLHRAAAVMLIVNLLWHLGYTVFTRRGRDNFRALIPRVKDFRDAFEQFFHNIGITRLLARLGVLKRFFAKHPYWLFRTPPLFDRYNFVEKFEYWAVAWGSAVMIASGFFMWKVEFSLRFFPLWVHNIFIIVHGYEAMLAFLAIIIWHMYNVHLNPEVFPMSKVWLSGRITGKELRLLHPLEYERVLEARRRAVTADRARAEASPAGGPSQEESSAAV